MILLSLLPLSVGLIVQLVSGAGQTEIFLPPDAEIVSIVGNGFKLQVNQVAQINREWKGVAEETAQLENPRRKDEDSVVIDANLYETTKRDNGDVTYGSLERDLQLWIEARATALTDRIERYESEMTNLRAGNRVVVQILLLNTLVDLENLTKENIRSLKWIKNKLKMMDRFRRGFESEVERYVEGKIQENLAIEAKVKGTNRPGDKWIMNTQTIRRILHEQRFSERIGRSIVDYLSGKFSMMVRSRMFELYRKDTIIEDDLYYKRAKGHVPAHFPFSAQDAIMNWA